MIHTQTLVLIILYTIEYNLNPKPYTANSSNATVMYTCIDSIYTIQYITHTHTHTLVLIVFHRIVVLLVMCPFVMFPVTNIAQYWFQRPLY